MPAVTVSLGSVDGVGLAITYDDRTGALTKVKLTNPGGRVVLVRVAAGLGLPFELRSKADTTVNVPPLQPTFLLDAEKRPMDMVVSFAVCGHAEAH